MFAKQTQFCPHTAENTEVTEQAPWWGKPPPYRVPLAKQSQFQSASAAGKTIEREEDGVTPAPILGKTKPI
jgi:hypothetical protein